MRELRPGDAAALLQAVYRAEVSRFISLPPTTLEGFERFILWAEKERIAGRALCLGVVEVRSSSLIGLFQVRSLDPSFRVAEWGFALSRDYWGTGLFVESACRVLQFVFDELGVDRLEARAALANSRGHAALRKLGAEQARVGRRALRADGEHSPEILWTLAASDWARRRALPAPRH